MLIGNPKWPTQPPSWKSIFLRLLWNHRGIRVETYTVATEWLVDQNYLKFCGSEIQDCCHNRYLENHFFTYPPEPLGDLSWNLHCSNRMTYRSKIAKIVLIGNPRWPIDLLRLLWNHGGIRVETYTVATEWLVDQNYIKFCGSEIQDCCHNRHLENHFYLSSWTIGRFELKLTL